MKVKSSFKKEKSKVYLQDLSQGQTKAISSASDFQTLWKGRQIRSIRMLWKGTLTWLTLSLSKTFARIRISIHNLHNNPFRFKTKSVAGNKAQCDSEGQIVPCYDGEKIGWLGFLWRWFGSFCFAMSGNSFRRPMKSFSAAMNIQNGCLPSNICRTHWLF